MASFYTLFNEAQAVSKEHAKKGSEMTGLILLSILARG
jgi:hypothetical protein